MSVRARFAILVALLGFPAESNAQAYVKSIEYVEIALGNAATTASAPLTKGQVTANCVPFASAMTTGTDQNFERILTDVYFTAGPSVTARREFSGGTVDIGVYVVEFDPVYVRVQQNTLTLPNGSLSVTAGITGVNTAKAALVFYYRGTFNSKKWRDHAIAGHFSTASQLTFQRDSSVDEGTIHWYVFEARNSEFSVQGATLSIAGISTSGTVGISSVDLTKSFVIASYRTTYDDDNMRTAGTMVFLNGATQLRAERDYPSSFPISEIRAFVVTLTGADVKRGSLSYTGTQATASISGVSTDVSMVWNGVSTGPGVMTSGANNSADVETAFQRLKLANGTTVQGDRRESTFNAIGRFEVINFGAGATPVELLSFTAEAGDRSVLLEWQTGSEISNLGFHLYRATRPKGPYNRITGRAIPGLGSSPAGARYSYRDGDLTNDVTYYYELEDIDTSGTREMHDPVSATPEAGKSSEAPTSLITVGEPRGSRLQVLPSPPGELIVELVTGGFQAELLADGNVRLEVPGFSRREEKGFPSLPVERSWLPFQGRSLKLTRVEHLDEETFENFELESAALPVVEASARTVRLRRRRHDEAPPFAGSYPESAARLLDTAYQQDVRKALVEVAPLRWNGSLRQLVFSRRVVAHFEVVGERDVRASGRRRQPKSEAMRTVLAQLETEREGLTGVRFEELFPDGRSRPLSPSSLRLSRQGRTVPFFVNAETLGPGATLFFLSEGASSNPYGRVAVYELEARVRGERMPHRNAEPSGETTPYYWELLKKEENRLYQAALVDAQDPWLWSVLFAPARERFPFEVSALAATEAPSRLSVRLQGTSDFPADPDHHVRLYVNGMFAGEGSWNGKESARIDVELGVGLLHDGENVLQLENVGDTEADYSMVMLDRFELSYPRRPEASDGRLGGFWSQSGTATVAFMEDALVVETTENSLAWLDGVESVPAGVRFRAEAGAYYDVVHPDAVLRAEVRRPLASRLRETAQAFDYVLIGPREFLEAASALVTLRRSQGLRVRTVPIEEVFSEFGFGEADPRAIREFLAYAYRYWRARPRYVLLLGDGSYDFKNYLGTGVKNHVPPLMIRTSYLKTASDPAMAAVNGDDLLPDLAIGRLPAANVEELGAMVAKILDYESSDVPRSGRVALVTDNPDHAGDFVADAQSLEEGVLRSTPVDKIRLSELGAHETRQRIVRAFDEGRSLTSYIGHGGIHLWADENVFDIGEVQRLAPQQERPILLTMNCLNGYFHFPYFNSLAEELVKAEGKGAVAAFSPSGLSLNDPAHVFHQALLAEILEGGHLRLGDAVLAAQSTYAESGAFPELIAIYHLFGDPALVLR